MAARYWIGGTGSWSDTAHWSATSGGIGGASVPTMDDDVYFDSNSGTGTVTVNAIANMRDCTFAQTQLITLANAAYAFNIFGSWTLCSNTYLATSFTGTGYVYLKATTSMNITSNGCTRAWNRIYFDGVGGTWTNQDDFDVNKSTPYLKNGHWNTNSKSINATGLVIEAGIKILTLGSSIFNGNTGNMYFHFNYNGMTLNAGTSTIINNNIHGGSGFYGGPFTFYNVIVSVYSHGVLSGNSIFNNLTVNYSLNGSHSGIVIEAGTITINNNFTINGYNASTRRLLIVSNTIGTPRTITCNGTITASNVDFRDIIGDGTANWDLSAITGGSGDCGGNSGITFTPAQTQYFKHTLGNVNWSDTTKWFSNYERTVQGRVPLIQDDAIFDENSFTGASILNINVFRIGGINMTEVNKQVTFRLINIIECYKNFILGNNITTKNTNITISLFGRGTFTINTFSKTLSALTLNSHNGIYIAENDINLTNALVLMSGIFNLNDYNLTTTLSINLHAISTLYCGNGTIEITRISNIVLDLAGNFYAENSTVKLNPSSGSEIIRINTNHKVFNKIILSGNHTGTFDFRDSNTIAELIIDLGRNVRFNNGTTQNISKLTAIGTPEQPITIGSITAGQRHNLNLTGESIDLDYVTISDSNVIQTNKAYAGNNSINGGNNVNWIFEALFNPIETWHRKSYNPIIEQEQIYYSVLKQQLTDTALFAKVLNTITNKKQEVMKNSIYYANIEPRKPWYTKFKEWLTKTQIKIENSISKSNLLHDYVGSWIAILSLLLVLIFDFNIYIVVVNPIIAGVVKELSDRFIRKIKPEFMDFFNTAIKGVILYILLLLLGY